MNLKMNKAVYEKRFRFYEKSFEKSFFVVLLFCRNISRTDFNEKITFLSSDFFDRKPLQKEGKHLKIDQKTSNSRKFITNSQSRSNHLSKKSEN